LRRGAFGESAQEQLHLQPEALNLGDRICVERFQPGGNVVAIRIAVSSRAELQAKQQEELSDWSMHGVFGTVRALDPRKHRITLETRANGTTADLSVDASGPVTYWVFPQGDIQVKDAMRGSWDKLAAGDLAYIYSVKDKNGEAEASVILLGGVRVVAGIVQSFDGLNEQIHLRSLRSGEARVVHTDFSGLYLIGRSSGSEGSDARKLYRMSLGDLRMGDSVLVLGREDRQQGRIEGLAVVSGLLVSDGVATGQGLPTDWVFSQLGLGSAGR